LKSLLDKNRRLINYMFVKNNMDIIINLLCYDKKRVQKKKIIHQEHINSLTYFFG